jgi:Ca2+-binding RTX toxin-like protein
MAYSNFGYIFQKLAGAEGGTTEVFAVDINRDGWTDIVGADLYFPIKDKDIPLAVFLNNGGTGLTRGSSSLLGSPVPATTHPRIVVTADFNGDGRRDVFIGDHGYDAYPSPGHTNILLLGKANGGFTNASDRLPSAPDFTHSAAAADIDGDSDIDLFVNNLTDPTSYFLLNDENANFTQSRAGLPPELADNPSTSTASLFLDGDGDGDSDLFLGTAGGAPSSLLLNDGLGNFANGSSAVPSGLFGAGQTVNVDAQKFDFNGDGRQDVLLVQTDANPFYVGARLQVLASDGAGALVDHTSEYIIGQPKVRGWLKYALLVDLNKDGAPDIIAEPVSTPELPVSYINDGRNHFYKTPTGLTKEGWGSLEVVDFNRDGWLDIVQVSGNGEGEHHVRINLRTPPPARITGDGDKETLLGGPAANTIKGGGGSDLLSGAGGKDALEGGSGSDTLLGGSSADKLTGGSGKDVLNGGKGADVFRFVDAPGSGNADKVVDFKSGEDKIFLGSAFNLGSSFDASEFVASTDPVAQDRSDRIIYELDTGRLLFDADGSRSGFAPKLIATFGDRPALTGGDMVV